MNLELRSEPARSGGSLERLGWSLKTLLCRILLALCLGLFCLPLLAQNPSATITGWISDPTGAAVPGATVTVTGVGTGLTLKTETNTAGIYWISGLVAGPYRVDISSEGFASVTEQGI